MIRVLVYLVIVALLAFGAVWFAERPGDVAITWQGRRIDTSVMVLLAAVAAVAAASVMLWSILRAILRTPDAVGRYLRIRRGVRGYLAVSRGLIAVGSGDARAAKKFTAEAVRIAPREPLTLLLSAQTAQLCGARVPLRRRRLERRARSARAQHAKRPHRQAHLSPPARGTHHRAGAVRGGERPRARDRARARGGKARARPRAGGGARRAAPRRAGRTAPGRAHHRAGVARQSASRSRRRLRGAAAGRFRAPALEPRRDARGQGARRRRGRACGRARRARRAGVRRRAQGAGAVHRLAAQARGGADVRA